MKESLYSGVIASPGIVYAKAFVVKEKKLSVDKRSIEENEIETEVSRFFSSRKKSVVQLEEIKKNAKRNLGEEEEAIFDGYLMILEDDEFENEITELITKKKVTAGAAIEAVVNLQVDALNQINDPYLKERASDMADIGSRLLKNCLGIEEDVLEGFSDKVILVADDLTPSQTARINPKEVVGFLVNKGGKTSHTAIMARSLEIPAIVGTGDITTAVKSGDSVILDALENKILINPNASQIGHYEGLAKKYKDRQAGLLKFKDCEARTLDKHRVELAANIGIVDDIKGALKYGAESVGLFRTEFLFMDRNALPDEEEQFNHYKNAVEKMDGPVLIRTLDIGGDKNLPYLNLPKELNPFLGLRAIRYCFENIELLKTQLRAIYRASSFGNLKIMFPMVTSLEEITKLKNIIKIVKKELVEEKQKISENVEIGIIIETPAAAISARFLIKEIDFFSIGTNDLIQCTLAVDRCNDTVTDIYEPFHPSVLELIKKVIDASHDAGKWTGMCGEFAGNPKATRLLLGMGLDEFSMSSVSIPEIKDIIMNTKMSEAKKFAKKILNISTATEIKKIINEEN